MNNQSALRALTKHLFDLVSRIRKPAFIIYKNNLDSFRYFHLKPANPNLIETIETAWSNKHQQE